ncbi:MAG: hypothetical protein LBG60_02070 [Bifidobacteriaceae bacterium]|jgi:hypothetical protein|nr:hypothetical protein [Bifidobacteriaceae bacterium]
MTVREAWRLVRRRWQVAGAAFCVGVAIGALISSVWGGEARSVTATVVVSIFRADGVPVDSAAILDNAIALGLSDADYAQLSSETDGAASAGELENAVSFKRISGLAVEATVALSNPERGRVAVERVVAMLVESIRTLAAASGASVEVTAENYPEAAGADQAPSLLPRIAMGFVFGLGLGVLALVVAYYWRPAVLGANSVASITDLPILARATADGRPGPGFAGASVLAAKLSLLSQAGSAQLISLVCASPGEAFKLARSGIVKRLADALGPEALVVSAEGRSGNDALSRWDDLARIGPHNHVVVSPQLQQSGAGAAELAELAKARPIVLVSAMTPLALGVSAAAGSAVVVAFAGETSTVGFASGLEDIRQVGSPVHGVILVEP